MCARRVILHTADFHLGKNRKYADYLTQQYYMLSALLNLVLDFLDKEQTSEVYLIVAGDLFDRNEDTTRDEFILLLTSIIYPLMDLKKKFKNFDFFIIDGNHDRQQYDATSVSSQISVLSPLTNILGDSLAVAKPKWLADKSLLLVPFAQHTSQSLVDLLKLYPAEFMVLHECCSGSVTDAGWRPPREQSHYINIGYVLHNAPQLKGVFLGDIHRSQALDTNGICWYSGSPITLDFGEQMPKGVLVHIFTKHNDTWQRDGSPELMSLLPYNDKLRYHKQLGVIDKLDNNILASLSKYDQRYLQFKITADVYPEIAEKLPHIFTSQYVAWEHLDTNVVDTLSTISRQYDEAGDSDISYYSSLIEHWIMDNAASLTRQEKLECVDRLLKDFASRC